MSAIARVLGRVMAAAVGVLAAAPWLALAAAAVVDRGPTGAARLSAFPAALATLDPLVWAGLRNSLIVAALVTLTARVLGVALARHVVGRRFLGRRPLALLGCAGFAVTPTFGALGLKTWLESSGWSWAESADELGEAIPALQSFAQAPWAWALWGWAALAWATPLVALATARGLRAVPPAAADAARLAGASRWRAWRGVVWPVVRPGVARALAAVFVLTLLDPGPPLVLGLRRTLASQATLAALAVPGEGQLSRAAALVILGLVVAGLAGGLIRWWGGPLPAGRQGPAGHAWPESVPWTRLPVAVGWLAWPTAFLAAPLFGLVSTALTASHATGPHTWTPTALTQTFRDPRTPFALVSSGLVALGVLAAGRRTSVGASVVVRPPLAVAVGVLALPGLLELVAGRSGSVPGLTGGLRWVGDVLDPERTPWVALVVAGVAAFRPLHARGNGTGPRAAVDAAVALGASPGEAESRAEARGWRTSVLAATLAATAVAPGLVLAPTAATRPLGASAVVGAVDPDGPARAAVLACLAVALNASAFAVVAVERRTRTRSDGSGLV